MTKENGKPILEVKNLTKRFPGVIALKDVTFDLAEGEIHSLCGENGAGKSTLIKTLSGIWPFGSYEGDVAMNGEIMKFQGIYDSEQAGIGVIYQELALIPEMTVAENIFLGKEHQHKTGGLIDWPKIHGEVNKLLDKYNLDLDPEAVVEDLGVGQQQLVEIVKALSKNSRVLLLDEPTAALTEKEVDILLDIVLKLKNEHGVTCVYISHKLDEVFRISDRITVIRDGQSIGTFIAKDTNKDEIITHMVGRTIDDFFPRRKSEVKQPLLQVKNLSVREKAKKRDLIKNVSFEVRGGEVLGIGGLMGAGRTELLMHIFGGFGERVDGEVKLNDESLSNNTPQDSIKRGLMMVSEDRKRYGLVLEQPIGFNLSLSCIKTLSGRFLIDGSREHTRNQQFFDSLGVKAPNQDTLVSALSGGNQQKVVLGKSLMTEPSVVFLDEPTRGIDVGAKVEIYELINKLTAEGKAVVLISSELPELMGMSDRIIMLSEGAIGGEFNGDEATQEILMKAAISHTQDHTGHQGEHDRLHDEV